VNGVEHRQAVDDQARQEGDIIYQGAPGSTSPQDALKKAESQIQTALATL
jgi:hypothetical protein